MTVLERLKAVGYDPNKAKWQHGDGHMECMEAELKVSGPFTDGHNSNQKVYNVEVTAYVPWSDGMMKPHPTTL